MNTMVEAYSHKGLPDERKLLTWAIFTQTDGRFVAHMKAHEVHCYGNTILFTRYHLTDAGYIPEQIKVNGCIISEVN